MLSPAQSKCLTDAVTVAVAVVLLTAEADGWTAAERGGLKAGGVAICPGSHSLVSTSLSSLPSAQSSSGQTDSHIL